MPSSRDKALVQWASEQNANGAAPQRTGLSEAVGMRVCEGRLKFAQAIHDATTGKVAGLA